MIKHTRPTLNALVYTLLFSLFLCLPCYAQDAVPTPVNFEHIVEKMVSGSLSKRIKTVAELATSNDPRSADILRALQTGSLFATKAKPPIVVIKISNDQYLSAISGENTDVSHLGKLKRVPIHNKLRRQLNTLLAQLDLNSESSEQRLSAVNRLISDGVTAEISALLHERQALERDHDVNQAIIAAMAVFDLENESADIRITALQALQGSLVPEVRTPLMLLVENDPVQNVREEATKTLNSIDRRMRLFRLSETIFFGLSLGSVFLLSAIGLAITFGVMGVINMAHGELMMIGAYTTWVVQQLLPNQIEASLFIAVPAAFLVAGLVGIAIERGVIQFLYGRPLETLLATFGISLILQQAARSVFSPLNRAVSLPEWMSGSLQINPALALTFNRLYILLFALMVFFSLMLILKKTSLGLKVRAVSQNRSMARAVGVRANWVDALTFGLGSGVAGIAGVALSQLTNVGPNLGQAYIIDSFMVVVFGGVGNLWGTLIGSMGLGILNKFLEPYAGAVLAKVFILVVLILFIQKRPKGLFPQKGRAAAD